MAGTTYQELLDGVAAYYGSGSDQWVSIARYGVNADTIPIIEQVPGVSITRSNSGAFLGFDYDNPFAGMDNPASIIDSNVQAGAYGQGAFNAQLPATAITDPSTGVITMESGARVASTGATVAAIADKVSLAVAGVAIGTKLGKLIDSGLYSLNPEWWDTHYPNINPETWDDIATTQTGKTLIRSIFGLEDDSTTMYADERLLAYTYMLLLQEGAYEGGGAEYPDIPPSGSTVVISSLIDGRDLLNDVISRSTGFQFTATVETAINDFFVSHGTGYYWIQCIYTGDYSGSSPLTIGYYPYSVGDNVTIGSYKVMDELTTTGRRTGAGVCNITSYRTERVSLPVIAGLKVQGILIQTSNINTNITPSIDGISDNPNASTHINPDNVINPTTDNPVTPNDNVDDVLQALKTTYPDLFNDEVYEDVPQEDGTIERISYIPVPYPNTTNINQPITQVNPGVDPQVTPQVTPETYPDTLTQQLTDSLTETPSPPDTGEGTTPPAVIPTGSASALYSIYNPTQGELNNFGAWLWSSNFVDQLLKLFNDPMQAIIGLHKVFAPPVISGTSTIKVGYLDSGVSSNVVGNQYTTVDCGTVNVSEYFGNVFDYDPFTQIYIYLPFVGIEKLDTGDVMRGTVGVKYHVDVLTGACLAEITVTRDGAGGIIYTFAGNCAVQYPISSGSYMGIVASLASIAGGVVGTVASGGALAPVAMGAVGGIINAHTRVSHSGAFSGNAGAMGVKKPYLIITRPQTCLADDFPAYDGYPSNKTTTLSACSGFVKCETCHIEHVPATSEELSEIESLLKTGVLI